MSQDPVIWVPAWRKLDSGLIVPSSVGERIAPPADPVPPEFLPEPQPVVFQAQPPSSLDQILAVMGEEELGLSAADLGELRAVAGSLPFEWAFVRVAQLLAAVWHMHNDGPKQVALLEQLGLAWHAHRAREFLAGARGLRRCVLAEQHLTLLQRLLVDHAREATLDTDPTLDDAAGLVQAIFSANSVANSFSHHLTERDLAEDEWLVYLLQNAVFNGRQSLLNAATRARRLFVELPPLVDTVNSSPLDEWFLEDYGLTAAEQHAAGFALLAVSGALNENAPLGDRGLVGPVFASTPLAGKQRELEAALSADRDWYAAEFAAALTEVAGEERSLAWERRPFLRRPFLRLSDGRWLLVSPRGLEAWIGEGFFHRAYASAERRGKKQRFSRFYGELVEVYTRELTQSVYAAEGPIAAAGRVFPPQQFGRGGGLETSDVAIDCGPDLVLIEVVSAGLSNAMQVAGTAELLAQQLEKMIFSKLAQLAKVAAAVLDGRATIGDIDPSRLDRVWPVLVTAGGLVHNEILWQRIERRTPTGLRQARVQPLTVLDLEDFELALGLVETGQHLPDCLAAKAAGPYARLELIRWVTEELRLPNTIRPRLLTERWRRLSDQTRVLLGFETQEA